MERAEFAIEAIRRLGAGTGRIMGVMTGIRLAVLVAVAAMLTGCGDVIQTKPLSYARSPQLDEQLKDMPKLQAEVETTLDDLFGPNPRVMRVPTDAPLPGGGIYLASRFVVEGDDGQPGKVEVPKYRNSLTGKEQRLEGGFELYRKNCLHCHGLSGDGEGPTAAFLWPKPRDFRQGLFKFASTAGSGKPTRDDLRRTLVKGIPNSSMPSFEALMTPQQIEQVLDYTMFLSMRGQVEQGLILTATLTDEEHADTFREDFEFDIEDVLLAVFGQWEQADSFVVDPPIARVEPTPESLARGRELYLGRTTEKLQCASCHGNQGRGDGESFVAPEVFYDVVFRGKSIDSFDEATQKLWVDGSLDDWGDPLRPANLNDGERTAYKGGRRPLDIYWRIHNGIYGAKMPAHSTLLKPEQIWDLVNFVLALPYQPELLEDVPPPARTDGGAVARR